MRVSEPEPIQVKDAQLMLGRLTERQEDVMLLAAQHMKNKVIAQELGIAPSTVEQRMVYVRNKLGTSDRDTTVRRYAELRTICGKPIYGSPHLDPTAQTPDNDVQDVGMYDTLAPPTLLEALDARFGRWGRLGLIVMGFLSIAVGLLLALAISNSLTDLMRGFG